MGTNPVQRPLPDDPTGYYKELRANWNMSWLVLDLGNQSGSLCYYPGLASYVLFKESADMLVRFHANVTVKRGYDGMYIDELTDDWQGGG